MIKPNPVKGKSSDDNILNSFIRLLTFDYFKNRNCQFCNGLMKGKKICKHCDKENSFNEEYTTFINALINCHNRKNLVKAKKLYEAKRTLKIDT